MYSESILPNTLKDFSYYFNKVPLYLKNSEGFIEHFRIWFDLLVGNYDYDASTFEGVVVTEDVILYLLNIFDNDYLQFISNLQGSNSSQTVEFGTVSDILDKLAEIYGVRRNFSVTYIIIENTESKLVTKELSLNNSELLTLIKTQIIKNYCVGTYEQIQKFYQDINLPVIVLTDDNSSATCSLILEEVTDSTLSYSDNIKDMFLSGLLTIENMGIAYRLQILNLDELGVWDVSNWDERNWGL